MDQKQIQIIHSTAKKSKPNPEHPQTPIRSIKPTNVMFQSSKVMSRTSGRVKKRYCKFNYVNANQKLQQKQLNQVEIIDTEVVDMRKIQENQMTVEIMKKKDEQIKELIQQIQQVMSDQAQLKQTTSELRQLYYGLKQFSDQMGDNFVKQKSKNAMMKKNKDDDYFDWKDYSYKIAADDQDITSFLNKFPENKKLMQAENQEIINSIRTKAEELVKEEQKYNQNVKKDEEQTLILQEAEMKMIKENIHLTTLKLQMSPNLWIGVNISTSGLEKKQLLEKGSIGWDKNKQRKTDWQDLKCFIVIEMHHGWRSILRKVSYQSLHYQVLFGMETNENHQIILNIRQFMTIKYPRTSNKKQTNVICLVSEKATIGWENSIVQTLINFKNGLIEIVNVQLKDQLQNKNLLIQYKYLGEEMLTQTYVIEHISVVTKEHVMKQLKMPERRTFFLLEVPAILDHSDYIRYEEVWEYLKKKGGIKM